MATRPSAEALGALLDNLSRFSVTYPEVGATRTPKLPSGYRHDSRAVILGRGEDAFHLGREALRHWQAHRQAGAVIVPLSPPLAQGTNLVVMLRAGPTFVVAPCRIVYVTDETDRFGFAYGTLPGHPERGEESFHISRTAGGEVSFEVVAFSRPVALPARLGSPVTRVVQRKVTSAYLEGVRRFASGRR